MSGSLLYLLRNAVFSILDNVQLLLTSLLITLPVVPQTRDLGVIVCANLSPTAHVCDVVAKVLT